MTENEFLRLDIGTVISDRFKKGIYFVIYDIEGKMREGSFGIMI